MKAPTPPISLLNDLAFKVVFGSETSTEILKSFINAVQRASGQPLVASLKIMNPL